MYLTKIFSALLRSAWLSFTVALHIKALMEKLKKNYAILPTWYALWHCMSLIWWVIFDTKTPLFFSFVVVKPPIFCQFYLLYSYIFCSEMAGSHEPVEWITYNSFSLKCHLETLTTSVSSGHVRCGTTHLWSACGATWRPYNNCQNTLDQLYTSLPLLKKGEVDRVSGAALKIYIV